MRRTGWGWGKDHFQKDFLSRPPGQVSETLTSQAGFILSLGRRFFTTDFTGKLSRQRRQGAENVRGSLFFFPKNLKFAALFPGKSYFRLFSDIDIVFRSPQELAVDDLVLVQHQDQAAAMSLHLHLVDQLLPLGDPVLDNTGTKGQPVEVPSSQKQEMRRPQSQLLHYLLGRHRPGQESQI